jgi:hypothetical protein
MDSTPFSDRVRILADFYASVIDEEEEQSDFVQGNADVLWVCLCSNIGWITINDSFSANVDDAWTNFCNYLNVDENSYYESFNEMVNNE